MAPLKGWIYLLLLFQQLWVLEARDAWHSILTDLPSLDGPQFLEQVAEPLVQLCANAYRFPEVICVPGWIASPLVKPLAPSQGGVHALVYERGVLAAYHCHRVQSAWSHSHQEKGGGPSGRIVLAFRGTQLTASQDSAADLCADTLLWTDGVTDRSFLPASCDQFDDDTLDYFSQAVRYTQEVLRAYPAGSLLLTGHSLGAGLALLVSAAVYTFPSLPVIAFSAVGVQAALDVRDLKLSVEIENRVFIIAHQWDEVMRTTWNKQVGTLCLYTEKLTPACECCFASPEEVSSRRSIFKREAGADDCISCFLQTHYLAKLIQIVEKGDQPICQCHS